MSTRAQNKGKIKEHARNLLKFFYQVGKKNMWIYMRQSIQEWTKKNLWKVAFKKFEGIWSA